MKKQLNLFEEDKPHYEKVDGRKRRRKHHPGQLKLIPTKQMIKEAQQRKTAEHKAWRIEKYKDDAVIMMYRETWPQTECYYGGANDKTLDVHNYVVVCWIVKKCVDNSASSNFSVMVNALLPYWPYWEKGLRHSLSGALVSASNNGLVKCIRPRTWVLMAPGYDLLKEVEERAAQLSQDNK